jgi:8-amino-7-oxononanoate synthase
MNQHPIYMMKALIEREQNGLLRRLKSEFPPIDFCSNDYLGFSRLGLLSKKIQEANTEQGRVYGSTGSRLISGNSHFMEEAEKQIALFHHAKAALIFNSGYDANLGLLSSVPQKTDLILYDELVHASVFDGIRLSSATHYKFRHNDVSELEDLIARHQKNFDNIYVIVESVYALDGDSAPLLELAEICKPSKNVFLIVDEAHAIGVFGNQGRGMCNALNIEQLCFARIYTYGKAMGCQGAVVVGSEILRNYLINFARSFIYTTALPHHCVDAILHAYQLLIESDQKDALQSNIAYFYSKTSDIKNCIRTQSAIHSLQMGSNEQINRLERELAEKNIHARAMRSPTVKPGMERMRFSIHSYNTKQEIDQLVSVLNNFKREVAISY